MLFAFLMVMGACSSNSETPANSSTDGDSGDTTGESEDSKGDDNSQSKASSTSNSGSGSSSGQDTTASGSESDSSSDEESDNSTASQSSSDSDDDDVESESSESSESGGLLSNGEKCDAAEECQSGFCPTASSGDGVCSECAMPQDCVDAGTGSLCVESASLGYFTCLTGELGQSCVDETECKEDLACSEVPLAGLFCGECAKDEDCGDGRLCWVHEPQQQDDLYRYCIDEKSLEIGRLCGVELHGDRACKEGFCELIEGAQGASPPLGVCSECRAKGDDCDAEETCVAAHMDSPSMDIVPSECVAEDGTTTGDDTMTGTGTDSDVGTTTGTDSDTGTTTGTDETGTDTDVY